MLDWLKKQQTMRVAVEVLEIWCWIHNIFSKKKCIKPVKYSWNILHWVTVSHNIYLSEVSIKPLHLERLYCTFNESLVVTFDPDLQVWWPYPNDPFVCKHGKAAVVEGQGHGQKLGHFCGDIWCLWNTFERN